MLVCDLSSMPKIENTKTMDGAINKDNAHGPPTNPSERKPSTVPRWSAPTAQLYYYYAIFTIPFSRGQ